MDAVSLISTLNTVHLLPGDLNATCRHFLPDLTARRALPRRALFTCVWGCGELAI